MPTAINAWSGSSSVIHRTHSWQPAKHRISCSHGAVGLSKFWFGYAVCFFIILLLSQPSAKLPQQLYLPGLCPEWTYPLEFC